MTRVTIEVHTAGVAVATYAAVYVTRPGNKRLIHTTREYPFGFTSQALDSAEAWCARHGYEFRHRA